MLRINSQGITNDEGKKRLDGGNIEYPFDYAQDKLTRNNE